MLALNTSFKSRTPFEDRFRDSHNIMYKYPDRIPVICERANSAKNECPVIDKIKYLIPRDLTVGQFIYIIRKRMKIEPEKGLFLFVGSNIVSSTIMLGEVYELYKDEDHFLYVTYSFENTFG